MEDLQRTAPVGVFDSGVGGISVLRHLHALLPAEALHYYADSLHAPYGNKSPEVIQQRALTISDFLIGQGAKALVVACNTATAAAIGLMRERYSLPVIGMEPAVKPAAAASKSGVIGVLATSGTLKSAQFAALLESYGKGVRVVTQACHGLVERIEQGDLASPSTRDLVAGYVMPLLDAGADTIVLGCTHYPFVRTLIEEVVGPDVTLIDTGTAVARQLQRRLQEKALVSNVTCTGQVNIWTNSRNPDAKEVILRLWGASADVCIV